ncbi:hypothetical protein X975_03086, partial [Stegodyphus mimosarum]
MNLMSDIPIFTFTRAYLLSGKQFKYEDRYLYQVLYKFEYSTRNIIILSTEYYNK